MMTEKEVEEYREEYKERVINIIRDGRSWLVYHAKTPYLIDAPASMTKLERLVKGIK